MVATSFNKIPRSSAYLNLWFIRKTLWSTCCGVQMTHFTQVKWMTTHGFRAKYSALGAKYWVLSDIWKEPKQLDNILLIYNLWRNDTKYKIIYNQLPKKPTGLSKLVAVGDFVVLDIVLNKLIIASSWNFSSLFLQRDFSYSCCLNRILSVQQTERIEKML